MSVHFRSMQSPTPNHPVVIIGAGPAGLTAAYHLSKHGIPVVVLEGSNIVGGIAQTAAHRGYRFDIGGHRFFTKNPEIEALWEEILGEEFLSVPRLSRIYYKRTFFDYPLKPLNAFFGLGPIETTRCMLSYLWARIHPITPEKSFEDWVSNRFGRRLFQVFFKTYTEKVWGIPTHEISADWAAQRIKGLSLREAILSSFGIGKKGIKTLIPTFRYPRFGPGQMWETATARIRERGGQVLLNSRVTAVRHRNGQVYEVVADTPQGPRTFTPSHVMNSAALRDLIQMVEPALPEPVRASGNALSYRDFLTVALIVNNPNLFPDNWIYIHDPDVRVGRVQNFRNWSKDMVGNETQSTIGLEYFCNQGDDVWDMADADLVALATKEIAALGLVRAEEVVDGAVVRMPKAYPVYDDTYATHVGVIQRGLAALQNFDTVGRNGMHKYNNQDHSMYTALLAARRFLGQDVRDPWNVNADAEYHEEVSEGEDISGRLMPRRLEENG